MNNKKTLDISEYIALIKNILKENTIISGKEGGRYYGKISLYLDDGNFNHIEKFETIK